MLAGNEAWMSLNFGQIALLTKELAALEHLKKLMSPSFFQLILIQSFINLQVTRICIISWMNSSFGQIGPPTTELLLAALERLKNALIDL